MKETAPAPVPAESAMPARTLTICNRRGLHARAASKFVNVSKGFESEVLLTKGDTVANGKSIMSVMLLAAPVGSEVQLSVSGPDEAEAFDALTSLVNDGFGELG